MAVNEPILRAQPEGEVRLLYLSYLLLYLTLVHAQPHVHVCSLVWDPNLVQIRTFWPPNITNYICGTVLPSCGTWT